MRTREEATKEWFRSWNTLDRDAFYALLAPDFVLKGVRGPQGVDKETMWKVMVAFPETFPDIKWKLGNWLVSDRDLVVCEVFESGAPLVHQCLSSRVPRVGAEGLHAPGRRALEAAGNHVPA